VLNKLQIFFDLHVDALDISEEDRIDFINDLLIELYTINNFRSGLSLKECQISASVMMRLLYRDLTDLVDHDEE
jgi:hypothetical protein